MRFLTLNTVILKVDSGIDMDFEMSYGLFACF